MLVLIRPQVDDWLELLMRRLHARMPGCLERILVVPVQPRELFVNLLAVCDVVLDPPHFNGMNTSLEAFSVGALVVTLPAALQRTRHTQAMYRSMGIDELVARTPEEYVDVALRAATDAAWRAGLRQRILAANAVLFENDSVVREFERFFEEALAARVQEAGS